jgi:hypothetical protein
VASKVRNKEGDIILPLSVNTEVDPQDSRNRWSYLSVIPTNRNWFRQFFKGRI